MDEGGFIYDSGVFNDDVPYYTPVNGRPWLVLPYSFETNDSRFWRGGLNSVGDFYEYMKDTFDVLYEEGRTHPKMMSVGLHCRIAGRPARSRAVDRFLRYAEAIPAFGSPVVTKSPAGGWKTIRRAPCNREPGGIGRRCARTPLTGARVTGARAYRGTNITTRSAGGPRRPRPRNP